MVCSLSHLAFGPWAHVSVNGSMSSIAWNKAMSHATVEQTGAVRPHLSGGVSFPFAACWNQASKVALVVKNLLASAADAGDPGLILDWEDLLEKEMAAHSSILVWKIPRTEEPRGLQSVGSQRVRHD